MRINRDNPTMANHMMLAYREIIRNFRRSSRWELAGVAYKAAMNYSKTNPTVFSPDLFDPLLDEPVEVVTPEGIQPAQFWPKPPLSAYGIKQFMDKKP
jgi:hypothetical protein